MAGCYSSTNLPLQITKAPLVLDFRTFSSFLDEQILFSREKSYTLLRAEEDSNAMPVVPVFCLKSGCDDGGKSLEHVAAKLQMYDAAKPSNVGAIASVRDTEGGGVRNTHGTKCLVAPCELSNEHYAVLHTITTVIDQGGAKQQTLTIDGGTGKSFIVRRICEEIRERRYQVVWTCPAGAGACQLTGRMTFHSALKYSRSSKSRRLSGRSCVLRELFGSSVVLVVVVEISMFKADLLVVLDVRLCDLYDPDKAFGGKTVLLVR